MTMQKSSNHSMVQLKSVNDNNRKDSENCQRNQQKPKEINGPKGLEPTRYGDWEKAGRCIDF